MCGVGPCLVYDGDCPFCSRYARYVRLNEAVGGVTLINARGGGVYVDAIRERGLDLNQGMVLVLHGKYYHGADCINRLALLSTRSGCFNRMNALLFSSPQLARFGYPVLKSGRSIALWLLGRTPL